MTEQLNREVCKVGYDNLINSAYRTDVFAVTIAANQGKLARGTALAKNSEGKMVILGTKETVSAAQVLCEANCILAKEVDATTETTALDYREGHFNADSLIVKSDYKLTAADKDAFRVHNIILSESL